MGWAVPLLQQAAPLANSGGGAGKFCKLTLAVVPNLSWPCQHYVIFKQLGRKLDLD